MLLVAALTLIVAGPLFADTVALGGLRRSVEDHGPAARAVTVRTYVARASLGAADDAVAAALRDALGSGADVARVVRSGAFRVVPGAGAAATADLVEVGSYAGLGRHASLVSGSWPEASATPVEAALEVDAAAALGLRPGDRLTLAGGSAGRDLTVQIVGTYQADADDPYWTGGALELSGAVVLGAATTRGPLVLAEADLIGATRGDLDTEWRSAATLASITLSTAPSIRDGIAGLPAVLHDRLPVGPGVQVRLDLADILSGAVRSTAVSRAGIVLLTLQFAVLAGYALLLVAGSLLDWRRAQTALLRSRGAGSGRIIAMAALESLVLAGTAALVSLPVAMFTVWAAGTGPLQAAGVPAEVALSPSTAGVAAAAALVAAATMTVPTLASMPTLAVLRAALGRQAGSSAVRRLGIDGILVVVAGIALWQLRLYGTPLVGSASADPGADPILVAAPALGLVAGSALAVRLAPRLAAIAEAAAARWVPGGTIATLGGRELARRPAGHIRAALLVVLAVALGTFAATQGATWRRSQLDQAAFESATDVRLVTSPYRALPGWAAGSAYRAIAGVRSAQPIVRASVSAGRAVRDATLLGLDARAVPPARTGDDPRGIATSVLADLGAGRGVAPGPVIAGRPQRIAVELDARLTTTSEGSGGADGSPAGIVSAAVVVRDADGQLARLDAGDVVVGGGPHRLVATLVDPSGTPGAAPAVPLTLEAVELTASPSYGVAVSGTIDVVGVESSDAASGESWAAVPLPPASTGWGWLALRGGGAMAVETAPGRLDRLDLGLQADPLVGDASGQPTVYRLGPLPSGAPVAAIGSDRFLDLAGAEVGEAVSVAGPAGPIGLQIVASAAAVAPLDPATPFLVVDRQTLVSGVFAATGTLLGDAEWWFTTDPGAGPRVAAELGRPEFGAAAVTARDSVALALSKDPVPLGVIGALGIGTVAAMLFAAIGLLVAAAASARERRGEFAILRALGLSAGQLGACLSLETASLLVVGLAAGTALGLALAWVVLPVTTFSASGGATVPPPVVVVPWDVVLPLYAAAAVAAVAAVVASVRVARAASIAAVIRESEA